MLRVVPWTREPDKHALIMERVDWNYSLFVAVVEQVAPGGDMLWLKEAFLPDRGYYRLRVQIAYRSSNIKAVLERHKLTKLELFKDEKEAEAVKKLKEETFTYLDDKAPEVAAVLWPMVAVKGFMAGWRGAGLVDLRLDNLEHGVEVAGTLEEIKLVHGGVLGAVDRAHAKLLWAVGFDTGEVVIAAPGKPPKKTKDKPKGPKPSTWR